LFTNCTIQFSDSPAPVPFACKRHTKSYPSVREIRFEFESASDVFLGLDKLADEFTSLGDG
jgi:hypothetical protein